MHWRNFFAETIQHRDSFSLVRSGSVCRRPFDVGTHFHSCEVAVCAGTIQGYYRGLICIHCEPANSQVAQTNRIKNRTEFPLRKKITQYSLCPAKKCMNWNKIYTKYDSNPMQQSESQCLLKTSRRQQAEHFTGNAEIVLRGRVNPTWNTGVVSYGRVRASCNTGVVSYGTVSPTYDAGVVSYGIVSPTCNAGDVSYGRVKSHLQCWKCLIW